MVTDRAAAAVEAAIAVAATHGLEVREPRVVRDLSNVLIELRPAPVIARVATTTATVRPDGAFAWLEREVAVASYLDATGARVVAPADELPPGPHRRDGLVVSFWRRLVDPGRADPADAPAALAALHEALADYDGALPPLAAVLDEVDRVLDLLGDADAELLRAELARVRPAVTDPALDAQPLHGDAHAGNLLRTPAGLIWTDFEDACRGPREWDRACMLVNAGIDEPGPFMDARSLQVTAWGRWMARMHPEIGHRAEARMAGWRERVRRRA